MKESAPPQPGLNGLHSTHPSDSIFCSCCLNHYFLFLCNIVLLYHPNSVRSKHNFFIQNVIQTLCVLKKQLTVLTRFIGIKELSEVHNLKISSIDVKVLIHIVIKNNLLKHSL